jgi:hypothetical protein
MNFQAYCFACEKRVSALTILDKEGLWKALDSGADIEVMHTSDKGRPPLDAEPVGERTSAPDKG